MADLSVARRALREKIIKIYSPLGAAIRSKSTRYAICGGGFCPRPAKNDLECFKIVTNFVTESYYKRGVRLTFFDVLSRITLDFIKPIFVKT